ncbi:MAG: phosphoribosylglycinamide formyltransferase [Clostridia bacterium]
MAEHRHRLAVFASGRGSNLESILAAAEAGRLGMDVALVVSDNPRARALSLARRAGIEAQVVEYDRQKGRDAFGRCLLELCRDREITVVALAGFMRILPQSFLDGFPDRVFNIHPALLPSFPGLHAQAQALEYGVRVSGCTVHLVDSGVDTGPIVLQAAVPVYEDDDEDSLSARILRREHLLYPRALALFSRDRLRVEGRRVRITSDE